VSCWALMLSCMVTGHSLPAMVGCAAIGAVERLSFRLPLRGVFAATAALAVSYLVLALSESWSRSL